ncbi:MAG: NAD(+)/NADH kinase [Desulfobacterales bacterium]|nr:NAD(+)/NADH kinase [Desulfobacterales bacterium]
MKRIGLYVKKDNRALKKADEFEQWLSGKGIGVIRKETFFPEYREDKEPVAKNGAPAGMDCVFVLGGDGTFLSASRWVGEQAVPLIGVKFGDIGFLAETVEEELYDAAEKILKNEYSLDQRCRLHVDVFRNGEAIASESVLNDVVINKGALARLANIETYINDHYLTTYKSDGLIIATPTGSTAYSLAAGGPVIHPAVQGTIITPICPFTLTNRCMIVPNDDKIKLRLGEKTSDIVLTFDGQVGLAIDDQDVIHIAKSPHPVNIISFPGQNYFDILKAKLRWSGGRI